MMRGWLALAAWWPGDDRVVGRAMFAGVFALLMIWLLAMPRGRIWEDGRQPPWWSNVRVWALIVAATQVVVYLRWG